MRTTAHADLNNLLGRIDPLDEDQLAHLLEDGRSNATLEGILSGAPPRLAQPRIKSPARRLRVLSLVGTAGAAIAAAAVMLASSAFAPAPVSAAVTFSQQNGYIVAKIVNPYASVAELRREFAAHKLDITLHLISTSPSGVGHIDSVGESQSHSAAESIQTLYEGRCSVTHECVIGLRVPENYAGQASIYLGRPARAGEKYESTPPTGAFAPGEPLRCTGLLGDTVATAMPVIEHKGLSVQKWRISEGKWSTGAPPASAHIWSIDPVAAGEVALWLNAAPLDAALQRLATAEQEGC